MGGYLCVGIRLALLLAASSVIAQPREASGAGRFVHTPVPGDALVFGVALSQDWDYFRTHVSRAGFSVEFPDLPRYWVDFREKLPWGPRAGLAQILPVSVRWELKDGRRFIAESIDISHFASRAAGQIALSAEYSEWLKEKGLPVLFPRLVIEVWEDLAILKWDMRINVAWVPRERSVVGVDAAMESRFADIEYVIAKIKGVPAPGLDFSRRFERGHLNKVGP